MREKTQERWKKSPSRNSRARRLKEDDRRYGKTALAIVQTRAAAAGRVPGHPPVEGGSVAHAPAWQSTGNLQSAP
jgi:hypothetical protein